VWVNDRQDPGHADCVLVEDALDRLLPRVTFNFAAGWEAICFKNGPIVSVDFFKNVVMPRYKRISKKLKAAGIKLWWIDCDGDVRPILPYMMEGGVNCLFPFEVNGCAHPAELLNQYGKDLRIMGGADKIELGKGPEAIARYMKTLVPLVERAGIFRSAITVVRRTSSPPTTCITWISRNRCSGCAEQGARVDHGEGRLPVF